MANTRFRDLIVMMCFSRKPPTRAEAEKVRQRPLAIHYFPLLCVVFFVFLLRLILGVSEELYFYAGVCLDRVIDVLVFLLVHSENHCLSSVSLVKIDIQPVTLGFVSMTIAPAPSEATIIVAPWVTRCFFVYS